MAWYCFSYLFGFSWQIKAERRSCSAVYWTQEGSSSSSEQSSWLCRNG